MGPWDPRDESDPATVAAGWAPERIRFFQPANVLRGCLCGCFGWMSIRRVRQTSAELLTSLTSRSCSGWAPRWCPRIGRRSAGSGGGRNGGRPWRTWMCWVPHILASTRMHMDSAENAAVSAGEFPPRLFQPVAVSAGEFLPRLSQPVLLMQCNGNSDDDDNDGGGDCF